MFLRKYLAGIKFIAETEQQEHIQKGEQFSVLWLWS
jgi:hypothetical protein